VAWVYSCLLDGNLLREALNHALQNFSHMGCELEETPAWRFVQPKEKRELLLLRTLDESFPDDLSRCAVRDMLLPLYDDSTAPLMRAMLVRIPHSNKSVLGLVVHHSLSDAHTIFAFVSHWSACFAAGKPVSVESNRVNLWRNPPPHLAALGTDELVRLAESLGVPIAPTAESLMTALNKDVASIEVELDEEDVMRYKAAAGESVSFNDAIVAHIVRLQMLASADTETVFNCLIPANFRAATRGSS
jgi:hypothetical protein